MAFYTSIVLKIKKLILLIFGVFRKALCCRKRSRRNSGMLLPITVDKKDNSIININNEELMTSRNVNINDCDANESGLYKDSLVNGNNYSNQSLIARNVSNVKSNNYNQLQETEPDFFKDMTPEFRKPKKVILISNQINDLSDKTNRFVVDMKATITPSNELGVIDDFGDASSWEDNAANEMLDTDATFRDMRQAERQRRIAEHQRIKVEKEMKRSKDYKPNLFATKIS